MLPTAVGRVNNQNEPTRFAGKKVIRLSRKTVYGSCHKLCQNFLAIFDHVVSKSLHRSRSPAPLHVSRSLQFLEKSPYYFDKCQHLLAFRSTLTLPPRRFSLLGGSLFFQKFELKPTRTQTKPSGAVSVRFGFQLGPR